MNLLLVYFVLSLYFAAIAFVTTNTIYIAAIIFAIFFVVFGIFINPIIKKSSERTRKKHELFHFINHFIISLAVTQSVDQAFQDSTIDIKGEQKEVVESIESLVTMDKLKYLKQYFEDDLYFVFLSIVTLFQEQGGDLLEMSSQLFVEATKNEEKQNAMEGLQKKSLIQFGSMWFLSTLILAFLRFGLANFYDILSTSIPYLLTATTYFLVAIVSFYIYTRTSTGEKQTFERSKPHEKQREEAEPIES